MTTVTDKIATLWPEITLLTGACVCLSLGLSRSPLWRRAAGPVAALSIVAAVALLFTQDAMPGSDHARLAGPLIAQLGLVGFARFSILLLGFLLTLIAGQLPSRLDPTADPQPPSTPGTPAAVARGMRGELFAFLLFSLTGAMLCAGADDLVWLFLALELTSLPTYVLVACARGHHDAHEAGVKYFFLGALAAAVFLYGFTLIYGATGTTDFESIRAYLTHTPRPPHHELPPLLTAGILLAVIGLAFKIAAAPMHFYAADVYQGAAAPVAAFLAFVPKTAGFLALVNLTALAGPLDSRPASLTWVLWTMAALTMTVGNVLGLLQDNVKRVLAYSSIAHSGYMLLGLISPPTGTPPLTNQPLGNGIGALMFYLPAYGLATLGAFATLACVETRGQEAQTYDDIAGLGRRYPLLGATLTVCVLSLIGLPPLVGFLGKLYLFGSAIQHGYLWLVVIAVINSAVSAVYYLYIVGACYFAEPNEYLQPAPATTTRIGATVAAVAAVALGIAGGRLVGLTHRTTAYPANVQMPDNPSNDVTQIESIEPPAPPQHLHLSSTQNRRP
jgi:NADH-quinone oxidoreductase subunit N